MGRRGGTRRIPNFPPTPVKLATMADFTGGLNLRGNAFQLANNETPDCLDVDLKIGGGFVQRKVVTPFSTSNPSVAMRNLWNYAVVGGSNQLVGQGSDGKLYYSTGSSWTATGGGGATVRSGLCTGAEFNGNFYVTDGTIAPCRWNGTTATTLGTAFNETIGTEGAADGNMPIGKLITAHMGRLFLAYTTESGTSFPSRIRWSHAGFAEDWRQEDFIDIDVGRDGDFITAIIQFRERLYIFKQTSCYELVGYGPSTFQVVPLSQDIGCVGPLAAVVSDVGLFTFSWPQGVYLDKGTGPYPIFDKIWPLIRDGLVQETYASKIALGWVNRTLWCALPYNGSSTNNRVYVYDPWIFKNRWMRYLQGPWYPYSLPIAAFATMQSTSGFQYLAAHATAARVGQLEQVGSADKWGTTDSTTNLTSYYRTDWFDLGSEASFKRWRHPEFVLRQGTAAESVQVDVYRDYDPADLYSTYFISPPALPSGLIWDDGTNTYGQWDDGTGAVGGVWNDPTQQGESIVKGQTMGRARAIQMVLTGPAGQAWGLDALTLKVIPIRVHG